jgi:hypothetical protein
LPGICGETFETPEDPGLQVKTTDIICAVIHSFHQCVMRRQRLLRVWMIFVREQIHSSVNSVNRMAPHHNRYVYAARAASSNPVLYLAVE